MAAFIAPQRKQLILLSVASLAGNIPAVRGRSRGASVSRTLPAISIEYANGCRERSMATMVAANCCPSRLVYHTASPLSYVVSPCCELDGTASAAVAGAAPAAVAAAAAGEAAARACLRCAAETGT